MAEYLKFRLTAAKAAVTMAFMALVGGLVGSAEADSQGPSAHPASFSWGAHYLKLDGLGSATKDVFIKLELKLNQTFSDVNESLTKNFYDKHKIDSTFLKIGTASSEFLKIRDAGTQFLKITDANGEFLKLDAANADFLKIVDANNDFLKIGGTATNSSELGGLTPDAFFQGHGNVVSGAVTVAENAAAQQLISLPGGIIVVSVSTNSDGVHVTITNSTSVALPAVQTPSAVPNVGTTPTPQAPTAVTLQPGNTQLPLLTVGDVHELTIQILPNSAFQNVVTMILTTDPSNGGASTEIAAQAFTGGV